jgi:hypothetical protein
LRVRDMIAVRTTWGAGGHGEASVAEGHVR